jgi:hypothetical protein
MKEKYVKNKGSRWNAKPLSQTFTRLQQADSEAEDSLAASPGELEKRSEREFGVLILEYLVKEGIADRVTDLPENAPFFFKDIGIAGNDVPRICSNARIIEPARKVRASRWAMVQWKTTDHYKQFVQAYVTKRTIDKMKSYAEGAIEHIDSMDIPRKYHTTVRGAIRSGKIELDDNLVRVCRK